MCEDDNGFLCTYYIHRQHKDHHIDTIDNKAEFVRDALIKTTQILDRLCILKNKTEENIQIAKMKLDNLLKERKIEVCIMYCL